MQLGGVSLYDSGRLSVRCSSCSWIRKSAKDQKHSCNRKLVHCLSGFGVERPPLPDDGISLNRAGVAAAALQLGFSRVSAPALVPYAALVRVMSVSVRYGTVPCPEFVQAPAPTYRTYEYQPIAVQYRTRTVLDRYHTSTSTNFCTACMLARKIISPIRQQKGESSIQVDATQEKLRYFWKTKGGVPRQAGSMGLASASLVPLHRSIAPRAAAERQPEGSWSAAMRCMRATATVAAQHSTPARFVSSAAGLRRHSHRPSAREASWFRQECLISGGTPSCSGSCHRASIGVSTSGRLNGRSTWFVLDARSSRIVLTRIQGTLRQSDEYREVEDLLSEDTKSLLTTRKILPEKSCILPLLSQACCDLLKHIRLFKGAA